MKAIGFDTGAGTRMRRQSKLDCLGHGLPLGGIAVLAVTLCAAGWCGTARAESGTVHQRAWGGLKMTIDTRWVSGGAYRPVRITVTPSTPPIADRTLTVELLFGRLWDRRSHLRVVQDIEIPAGSTSVQATLSVPQTAGWSGYQVNVLEDGQLVPQFGQSGPGDDHAEWAWGEMFPKLLFVADKLPDTSSIAGLFDAGQFYQYRSRGPQAGGPTALPTGAAALPEDLPTRWIDYTNLDLALISYEQLASLADQRPEAFRAIVRWTFAGGNLCVYGIGRDWRRLGDLESLVGVAPGAEDPTPDPLARGWSKPDARLFGRSISGAGPGVTDPYLASDILRGVASQEEYQVSTYGYGNQVVVGPPMAAEPAEKPDQRTLIPRNLRPGSKSHFVFRPVGVGMLVAMADQNPLPGGEFESSLTVGSGTLLENLARGLEPDRAGGSLEWAWLLNTLGSARFLWYQRHGMSTVQENPQFWEFLIPGVGLAPVVGFRVLITLFVLAIGPLNYFLLRRFGALHLLVVTIPLGAIAVTLALFGYALVADGLGTRVRVRSFTRIDQQQGQAACWSRLSYYAGVAPLGGLRFPDDVAVIPLEHFPVEQGSAERELIWEQDQWLAKGWLASRTPTQLLTMRSRATSRGLTISGSEDNPESIRVENGLGTRIVQLVVRDKAGPYYWAADLGAGAAADAEPVAQTEAQRRLAPTFAEHQPRYPPGLDRYASSGFSGWGSYRRRWLWMANQTNAPPPQQETGLLEQSLLAARSAALEPGSYLAVVEQSPEAALGTPAAREEASLHVILGTW